MEVHLKPETQAKLDQIARDTGRTAGQIVEDAVLGLFDELAQTRAMLDRRYDDIVSGKVQLIDGDEALHRLLAKNEQRRQHRA